MTEHATGTREEWLAARAALLDEEKALTRRSDELARKRQQLPWVRVDKDYRFETERGDASLADLFRGRSQLIVHHFMWLHDAGQGCPSCSSVADGYNGFSVHLEHHGVAMTAVSRAPLDALLGYRKRMGWDFPWASSVDSDFNFDFGASLTEEQIALGREYGWSPMAADPRIPQIPDARLGHSLGDGAGISAFVLDDGVVYHTYSAHARGTDILWGMYQWLDRAPLGRNENGPWFRRHDEYEAPSPMR